MSNNVKRVAAVTGGSRGVGKAIVLALADAGMETAFCYRQNRRAAEEVTREVESRSGCTALAFQADITTADGRQRFISAVRERHGRLDVLVNNAGSTHDALAVRMRGEWDEVVELDLTVPFRLAQLAIPIMLKGSWGRIVNIGSVAAAVGLAGQTNYTAAKAGLEGMTRSLAQEYGRRGITVNTVSPGFMETELTADSGSFVRNFVDQHSAIGAFVTPASVASAVSYLASEAAWAITGQTIHVDGGLVKR